VTKKATLQARIEYAETRLAEERAAREASSKAAQELSEQVRCLTKEVENMRANWRPVPITHEWQPVNPRCALCDEHRDSPRHHLTARQEDAA
jgi:septal ring factor EnvC (AmiA/AmiB activator)